MLCNPFATDHDVHLSRIELNAYPTSNLTVGQTLQLSCQAQDIKQLTTVRLMKGERLIADGSSLFAVDSSLNERMNIRFDRPVRPVWTGNELHANLTIKQLKAEDAGEYLCVVITPYGKTMRSISVRVQEV